MHRDDLARLGWEQNQRVILKGDVESYVQSDPDVIEVNLRIGLQMEKVEVLTEILRAVNSRTWHIGRAIDWIKFKHGIN